MKRLFSFMAALAIAGAATTLAQPLQQGTRIDAPAAARTINKASIDPASGQAWWGYVAPDADLYGLGVGSATTYHCAIFIPGDNATAAGKTIHALRFALYNTKATDVSAWVSETLPASAEAATVANVAVDKSELGGIIDVALPEPYAMTDRGVYVGYTFTISGTVSTNADKYPICFTQDTPAPNTLLLRFGEEKWADYYSQGFGRLYMQVLLEGDFPVNAATLTAPDDQIVLLGGTTTATLIVTGGGTAPVTSIDYVIGMGDEQHAEAEAPIAFGATGTVKIPVEAGSEKGEQITSVVITKVNGQDNELLAEAAASLRIITVDELVTRRVAVEEFTGTGCGWCPRGIIGMENLRHEFGDQFVGIAIHQYNGPDAMYIAATAYAKLSFSGAPSCRLNRHDEIDPHDGTNGDIADDFRAELDVPALVGVEVEGLWNADSTAVEATATALPLIDGLSYKVEFVLLADSLTGTTAAWNQSNYYYQYTPAQAGATDDLAIFCKGGTYGQSSVKGWKFNDVAISSSYTSGTNRAEPLTHLSAGEKATSAYTLKLPTKAALKNALRKDHIYVAVLLIDELGSVANAAKARVIGIEDTDGIAAATTTAAATRYTIDGRQVSTPQRGVNIVRMADGTIRKVMVK